MVENNQNIKLDFINDARIILLGISAFLVTFFHTYLLNYLLLIDIPVVSHLFNFVQKIGNCGVDIFLFLSGIGLYFSLSKNNLKQYYKNRFMRILPEYIIVIIIYSLFVKTMTGLDILKVISGLSFFIDGLRDGWYIAFIMAIYIIFPLIYKMIKKYDISGLFLSLLLVVAFNFVYSYFLPTYYFKIEIGLTRIPVFLIGVFFGKKIYNNEKISLKMIRWSMIINVIVLLILYLNVDCVNLGIFARYLYCPLAICSVINISWLYSVLKNKDGLLLKPLKFLGNHSLEMYLFFEKTCYILEKVYSFSSYILIYILGFCISIVLSYILKKLVNMIVIKISCLFKVKSCV